MKVQIALKILEIVNFFLKFPRVSKNLFDVLNSQKKLRNFVAKPSTIPAPLRFNPLHPNIDMHIPHTVLSTFAVMLTWRICYTTRRSTVGDHFLYSYGLKV